MISRMNQPRDSFLEEIVLLADPVLLPVLGQVLMIAHPLASPRALMRAEPYLRVTPIHTREALEARAAAPLDGARLLICGSDVIVPAELLAKFPGPSYNIHPGPPERPGRFPSVFALYDDAPTFGTTMHEVTPEVDAGPIVAVTRFAIPEGVDRAVLDAMSFESVLRMLTDLCPMLVRPAPLPRIAAAWSHRATRQADFDALCRLPSDVDATEFARRLRAVGEGPDHALEIALFGNRFRLENRRGGSVVVGGLPRAGGS
jgi:methionyl-tRNA formyltransferase